MGASSVKSFPDSLSSCLCLNSIMSSSGLHTKAKAALHFHYKDIIGKRRKLSSVGLSTSFLNAWRERRIAPKMLSSCPTNGCSRKKHNKKIQGFTVFNELGGQYEDTFNDVKNELINYFTFKAVRTVLEQLYEMNPPQYTWLHNFIADNVTKNKNGKRFLQILVKERQELAERVMITRLSLYSKWIKKCDHGEIYKEISEENLELMRNRLIETIIWPSDDNVTPDH